LDGPLVVSQKPVPSTGEGESVIVVVVSSFAPIIMDGTKKPVPHEIDVPLACFRGNFELL